jgi:hypothetical protein
MAAAALVLLVTLMFMIGAPRPHRSLQPWALAIVNLGSLMVGVGAPLGVLANIPAIGVLEHPLVHRASRVGVGESRATWRCVTTRLPERRIRCQRARVISATADQSSVERRSSSIADSNNDLKAGLVGSAVPVSAAACSARPRSFSPSATLNPTGP